MLDYRVMFKDAVQVLHGLAAIDHEIFTDDFKPIDIRFVAENIFIMGNAKADADAKTGDNVLFFHGVTCDPNLFTQVG